MRVRCTGVYVDIYIYIFIVYCPTPGFCQGETWVDLPLISIDNKLGFDTVNYIYIYVTLKTSLCQAMAVLMMGAACQAHPSKMNA